MLKKSIDDFKEKYPHVRVGTIISMCILDILTKTAVFCYEAAFYNTKRHIVIKCLVKRQKNHS